MSVFGELQMQTINTYNTIVETRRGMNEILRCFLARPEWQTECMWFATKVRNLSPSTIENAKGFMVQEEITPLIVPAEYRTETYGMFRDTYCTYTGRFVYPVMDVKGNVMGWCGYDKFSDTKYLDSTNFGYKAKDTTVYGMEKIEEYYRGTSAVWFTEGIVCTLYLRQINECSLATLGSHLTPYVAEIIRRFGPRARVLVDSDEAGNSFKKQTQRLCPQARVLQSRIAKDLDDSKDVDPEIEGEVHKLCNPFYRSPMFT